VVATIEKINPKILGISVFTDYSRSATTLIAEQVKKQCPHIKILLGGHGISKGQKYGVLDAISFGEKLESSTQELEAQIKNFLLEQINKKPSKAIILSEEQLSLWHSLQNTLRLGARISTAHATNELIKDIKNYTQKNTCRNFVKVNEGLDIAVDLLDRAQKSFQENNYLFGQTFLNQAHKVLATFAPLALQITTDSIQFSKED
jgi:hypothetical protein